MANKFTRKIDEMFARFGKPGDKYIILGYCHSGDEDGGTKDYEYFDCLWECNVDGTYTGPRRKDHCVYYDCREQEDAFEKDWDELTTMLWNSYREIMGPDFEGTTCYYYRFYAVTNDYKLVTFISRGDLSDCDKELLDLDTISEEDADSADDPTNANSYGMVYYIGGIVYNYNSCRDQIEAMLPEGWRIPTSDDITDLTSVIPTSTAGMKALMLPAFGGNNSTGFNGASAGQAQKQREACFEDGYPEGTLQLIVLTGTSYNSFVISHKSSQYHLKYHNNEYVRLISLRVCRNA